VHPVGGGVFCYVPLAQEFSSEQPVYGLRAPGLDSGEQPESSIEALADRYVNNIRKVRKSGPYALGGWSMGALIAIEMARRLRATGDDVSVLLLVDPVHGGHEITEATKIALLSNLFGSDAQAGQSFNGMEPILKYATQSLGAEQVTRSLNVFKHHLDAIQKYRGDPYSGVATAFQAEVPIEDGGPDEFRRLCPNAEIVTLSGDHFGVLRPPILQQLADHFKRLLQP
jgi:thioesterase domain-containing protein